LVDAETCRVDGVKPRSRSFVVMHPSEKPAPGPAVGREFLQKAEAALRRLGYSRIPGAGWPSPAEPQFWVQEAGVPRRTFPVFLAEGANRDGLDRLGDMFGSGRDGSDGPRRAIVVVGSDRQADEAWERLHRRPRDVASECSILIVPARPGSEEPRWHAGTLPPKEVLRLATGIVVGMFRQARAEEGSNAIDFGDLLRHLRNRFGVDVHRSLGVTSDEDALFLLYQLALRDSYAPGDPGSNLHLLVLKPTGPAARLPWFAA
jgi:hypothetical protein